MSDRKKTGIGLFISGVVFLVVGFFFTFAEITPDWVAGVIAVVGLVAEYLGFKTVFPDTD